MVVKAKSENPTEFSQGGTVFGIGLLMGYICLLYGRDNGYTVGMRNGNIASLWNFTSVVALKLFAT